MDNIRLRKLKIEDKERLLEFADNEKISINLRDGFPHPYTEKDAERFLSNVVNNLQDQIFAIEYNGIYVGNISLIKCSDVYRKSAEIGYLLDEKYWNKGIMTRAVDLICEYGFREMDLVRIYTGVFEYNIASQKVLERCGFVKEAVFRKSIFKNGKIWDEIRYAKFKENETYRGSGGNHCSRGKDTLC
ncbi:MAG TPA: GNAT family N-acetyltransferase [Rikenellaceae bacterium]|nr:GNAT family N-acetyltransferase [Rikenellaceae bacterium]